MVNDVWGFQRDPALAEVAAEFGAGAVLMHNREAIEPEIDIVEDILRFLERSLAIARRAGLGEDGILLDPGIGFGKTVPQNLAAIAAIPRLKALGYPVLLGVSRKSFIQRLLGKEIAPPARLPGSVAANTFGALAGADVIRVHDVAASVQAMRVLDALRSAA
jgi:dihydropteroate synthase